MRKVVAAIGCSVVLFMACGSNNQRPAASQTTSASATAFCTNAKAVGSLSKGAQDAIAMSPSEAKKDFEALAAKVTALKAAAPPDLVAVIDTVAARFSLEAKAEEMKAKDPNGGQEEAQMLADHKTADDSAFAKLVAGVKSTCNIDIS